MNEHSDYICPQCATFNVRTQKTSECLNCGSSISKRHLRLVHDYAKYVYTYGHMYRSRYQDQVDNTGEVGIKFAITPDSIYHYIGLAMLSGVVGNIAWEVVKTAAKKIVVSYNSRFNENKELSDQELHEIFRSFEIFLKHMDDMNEDVKAAIFEEIFAHESGKYGKKMMENSVKQFVAGNQKEKAYFEKANQKLLKKVSKELKRRVRKLQEAEDESFDDYWGKIKIEK